MVYKIVIFHLYKLLFLDIAVLWYSKTTFSIIMMYQSGQRQHHAYNEVLRWELFALGNAAAPIPTYKKQYQY